MLDVFFWFLRLTRLMPVAISTGIVFDVVFGDVGPAFRRTGTETQVPHNNYSGRRSPIWGGREL